MRRVLHVIGPLRTGGAQTQLLGLVRTAHGALWDATVVATSGGAMATDFAELDCPVTVLRRLGSPGIGRMWRLRRIVRTGGFDVIHGNLWQSNLYCRLAVAGMRDRPAVVISERNVEMGRSFVKRSLDAGLASLTDAYVGNTAAVGTFIRTVHPVTDQQVAIIPNAVDREVFHPPLEVGHRGTPRIGSVGRLDHEKGFDVLIEAIRLLHSERVMEVAIVGEGPERPRLMELARGLPITFMGSLPPGSAVADFLRGLDVFVLPSTFREGRPNAILEALAVELPVVTTDIEGMDEIIRGRTLVPPGDPRSLADAIGTAVAEPERWRRRTDPVPIMGFTELAARYATVFTKAQARRDRLRGRRHKASGRT